MIRNFRIMFFHEHEERFLMIEIGFMKMWNIYVYKQAMENWSNYKFLSNLVLQLKALHNFFHFQENSLKSSCKIYLFPDSAVSYHTFW